MAIYKPSLLDKFKDFVNGLKANWEEYEAHVADFEAHLDQYEAHVADFETHLDQYEAHVADFETHLADYASTPEIVTKESGTAIKFPSGLMICHKRNVVNVTIEAGAVTAQDWTYPEPFVSAPTILLTKKVTTNNAYLIDVGLNATFVNHTSARITIKNNYTSTITAMVDVTAIGRWK